MSAHGGPPMSPLGMSAVAPGKPRSWLGRTLRPMARGSLRGCIFTLMSAAIGPGALLLPYMFRLVGVPLALLALCFGAYTSAQSLRFIISLVYLTGRDSYPASVAAVLGPGAGHALSHVTTFVLVLGTGSHLKSLGELLSCMLGSPLREVLPPQLLAIGVVFPISASRDISFLRHVALIAPVGLLYVLGLILARGIGSSQAGDLAHGALGLEEASVAMTTDLLRFGEGGLRELPRAWSIVLNAMTCHHLAVPVYKELHCAKAQRVNKVVLRSITSISLLYALVGSCGFLTHGATTPENLLLVYSQGDSAAFLAQTLVACTLLVATPLNVHALRGHLLETLPAPLAASLEGASVAGRLLGSALLVALPAGICCAFPSVSAIVGVGVGFGLVAYMFVVPSAALCALRWGSKHPGFGTGMLVGTVGSERSASHESFQDLLLSSPLSTPLLSPRLGSMVSPSPSSGQLCSEGLGELEELTLPSAECEEGPVFLMQTLPLADHEPEPPDRGRSTSQLRERGRLDNCTPPRRRVAGHYPERARSPSPSPSDLGCPSLEARWSPEFALALASLALGSCLGLAAALDALAGLVFPG